MPTSLTDRSAKSGAAGFTLIELLVVLVVLAVAASLVAPPLSAALGVGKLRAEVTDASTALREARAKAMTSGRTVEFVAQGARSWRVGDRVHRIQDGVTISLDVPPEGVNRERQALIRFFPDGRATGGRVVVTHGERRQAIAVDWLTGRVREE